MPADLIARAKAVGLCRLALPASLGGLELDPLTFPSVAERLAEADGSAGWTIVIGNSTAFFAWLDPDVARDLLADDVAVASTSVFAPRGAAVPTGRDQLTITGRWPFNSVCDHAEWNQVGVMVMDGDRPRVRADGQPDWRFALSPPATASATTPGGRSGCGAPPAMTSSCRDSRCTSTTRRLRSSTRRATTARCGASASFRCSAR